MYYPYLRGKQFELIALREMLMNGTLGKHVVPIIEPVKASSTLLSTLRQFQAAQRKIAVIQNPEATPYQPFSDAEVTTLKQAVFFIPARLVHNAEDIETNKAFENPDRMLIVTKSSALSLPEGNDEWQRSLKVIAVDNTRFIRRVHGQVIELDDSFDKAARNADYAETPDQFFSDNHRFYQDDGFIGFSDYSIIGSDFVDKGFAPLAVAIHIVYFDDDDNLYVHHFVSTHNDDISDPAGKFGEALDKLMYWYTTNNIVRSRNNSAALQKFVEMHNNGQYPGLGVVKKLSIQHHFVLDLDRLSSTSNYGVGIVSDFQEIIDLYTPADPSNVEARKLSDHLRDEWGIFNLEVQEIDRLIGRLLRDYFAANPGMQLGLVAPIIGQTTSYYQERSILSGQSWQDFEEAIRKRNRFHNGVLNPDLLKDYLEKLIRVIPENDATRFRARILTDEEFRTDKKLSDRDIGPAPSIKATAGRLNAAGISYLYLVDNEAAAFVEIKAAITDLVAVGEYRSTASLTIVDLEMLSKLSPFNFEDKLSYMINRPILLSMDGALRNQSGSRRSEVDYAPTEYISDLIKTIKIDDQFVDGIAYRSTVYPGAIDLVLFNCDKIHLSRDVKVYRVSGLNYSFTVAEPS